MDWIKKNSEKFALLLISIALLGVSIFLVYSAHGFLANFANVNNAPVKDNTLPPLDTKSLDAAQASLEKSAAWSEHKGTSQDFKGSLFVSRPYIVQGNTIVRPDEKGTLHPPVPNKWLIDHTLNLLDENILQEDADGDGFTNLQEFNAKTDPNDPKSHPPYTSVLFLEQFTQVRFRLKFMARPDDKSFQIDTVDIHQPTQILQMGDPIAGTKFTIVDFKEKHNIEPDSGIDHDVSELTVQNTETKEKVVLIYGKEVDSPDSYGKFKYTWLTAPSEFTYKKNQDFTLKPETDVHYKLIDIDARGATIQNLKTNEQIKIPLLGAQP